MKIRRGQKTEVSVDSLINGNYYFAAFSAENYVLSVCKFSISNKGTQHSTINAIMQYDILNNAI